MVNFALDNETTFAYHNFILRYFFSSFLLNAFGSLGYYFWTQVHEGNSDTSTFNSTELALTVLAVILLTIVLVCSAVLLHNLFALTFFKNGIVLDV